MDKKLLTIQDISCVGQCSLTVAMPVISACKIETCILPSAVLSTHTGGFTGYTFRDLTKDIPLIAAHWKKEGISFDALYTGYLGSVEQIKYVEEIADTLLKKGAPLIVDPACADNGLLYPGFEPSFIGEMKSLVAEADIALPNITEASMLVGAEYRTKYDRSRGARPRYGRCVRRFARRHQVPYEFCEETRLQAVRLLQNSSRNTCNNTLLSRSGVITQ